MKRFCLIIMFTLSLLSPMLMVNQAAAVNIFGNCTTGDACQAAKQAAGSAQNPAIKVIKVAIDILSFVVGVAAVVGVVVSGLRLITAAGDSNGIASARSGLTYSLIGVAVVIFAQLFVTFVLNKVNL